MRPIFRIAFVGTLACIAFTGVEANGPRFGVSGGIGSADSAYSSGEISGGKYSINGSTGAATFQTVTINGGSGAATLVAAGTPANVSINLDPKGTGTVQVNGVNGVSCSAGTVSLSTLVVTNGLITHC